MPGLFPRDQLLAPLGLLALVPVYRCLDIAEELLIGLLSAFLLRLVVLVKAELML